MSLRTEELQVEQGPRGNQAVRGAKDAAVKPLAVVSEGSLTTGGGEREPG